MAKMTKPICATTDDNNCKNPDKAKTPAPYGPADVSGYQANWSNCFVQDRPCGDGDDLHTFTGQGKVAAGMELYGGSLAEE